MRRVLFFISLTALIIGLAPVISALSSGVIASILGCDLDEGSMHSCLVLGRDIGPMLYTMFVLGWLGLMTLPLAAAGALGLGILGLIALVQKLRR